MMWRVVVLAATALASGSLTAQTAAEHIVAGDRQHVAMNAHAALTQYQDAIRVDAANAEALWKAAREAVDLGEFSDATRDSLYALGEQYARRAVQADPGSAMAHFALAKAIGRHALSMGKRDRVRLAGEVRAEALEAIRLDSANAGAWHVLGVWNAEIMRLSGIERFFAKNLLGGKTFGAANWADAERFLERSVALEPDRIVHHLDLARVYRDRGDSARARTQYQAVLSLARVDFNDSSYQTQARRELADLH